MLLDEVEKSAKKLMRDHGLSDWSFVFDRAYRRFGCCNFNQRTISLSRRLAELNDEAKVRDTLLHEIAHALVGPRYGHSQVWRKKVLELGGLPKRCVEADVILPRGKYRAYCPHCQREFSAQRKRRVACGACCKKFNRGRYSEQFLICFIPNS